MKEALQQLIAQLPSLRLGLSHPQLIADTTWLNLTASDAGQKVVYIFRSTGHELLVATNGVVQAGSWDFFPNTNSVSFHYEGQRRLYNALLVDGRYLVLKQDGHKEGVLLANQAHFMQLMEAYGKNALRQCYAELLALAKQEWPAKKPVPQASPAAPAAKPLVQEEPSRMEEAQEPITREEIAQAVPEVPAEMPIQETVPELQPLAPAAAELPQAQAEAPSGQDLLKRYRQEAANASEEDEEGATPFNLPKQPTLNDRLKAQVEQRPSLLDQLSKQQPPQS
jgi:hypothetical protein